MNWAKNRTVVVFGDSVARENVAYFCEVRPVSLLPPRSCSLIIAQLIGAKLDRITWHHPYAPSLRPTQTPPPLAWHQSSSESTTFATPEDPDADPELVRDWKPKPAPGEGDYAHLAHVCFVKEWGLLLVQQFQYG